MSSYLLSPMPLPLWIMHKTVCSWPPLLNQMCQVPALCTVPINYSQISLVPGLALCYCLKSRLHPFPVCLWPILLHRLLVYTTIRSGLSWNLTVAYFRHFKSFLTSLLASVWTYRTQKTVVTYWKCCPQISLSNPKPTNNFKIIVFVHPWSLHWMM